MQHASDKYNSDHATFIMVRMRRSVWEKLMAFTADLLTEQLARPCGRTGKRLGKSRLTPTQAVEELLRREYSHRERSKRSTRQRAADRRNGKEHYP